MTDVVVLVPGIMGSVLKLEEELIWPGNLIELRLPYRKMDKLLHPDLKATDCIRSFVMPVYKAIIDVFDIWGFNEHAGTLVIAPYDWRKSNRESARTLASMLDRIVAEKGADAHISLVAHSMGGLVSRYFLESGEYEASDGWKAVKDLITLATPHRGAAVALPVVAGLEKQLFLNRAQVKQLCDDPRYPSAYELLPHSGEPIAWEAGHHAGIRVMDIYDRNVAARLGLNLASLAAAASFHSNLNGGRRPAGVNYFCFAGNGESTASYIRLISRVGNVLRPDRVDQKETGDGTVPIWSSTLPKTPFLYVPGEHGTIFKGYNLQRHLALLLGREGVLAAGAPHELSVEPAVVEHDTPIQIRLIFGADVTKLTGRLVFERITFSPDGNIQGFASVEGNAVVYQGPAIDSFLLNIPAPTTSGHYLVAYYDRDAAAPSASAELIVQET